MNINELIEQLEELRTTHGNCRVMVAHEDIENVELIEAMPGQLAYINLEA